MSYKKISLLKSFAVLILLTSPSFIYALPEGENVVSGSATFERPNTNTLNINTPSDRLIVEYNSFNIAQPETVNFYQPSSSAIALNRVVGIDPSSIFGTLTANGRIFVVNPNGVLFGPNSRVDVAALVASTLNISNKDFLNGNYNFYKQDGRNGFIINQGQIASQPGGYICLLSGAVENSGIIQAELGTVVLAAGEKMTLALDDLNEISVVIDEAIKTGVLGFDSAIKNSGTISANGGKVILTAKVLNNVFDYAINNTGIIEARNVVNHNGIVELVAEGAPILNTGKIEAGEVKVEVKNSDFINKGEIITDGTEELPDGGKIEIEAATVLQQGLISANANEEGTAGEIIIVSESSTVLDDGGLTEACALGIVGNGGRILIDSTGGNTVVNKNAVIDVSAGAISGNAGFIEVSAFNQLGFYGVLNGRAPPEYQGATVLFDPRDITIATGGSSPTQDVNPPGIDEAYADHGTDTDITISPAALQGMTAAEVYLQASRDIFLNNDLSVDTSIKFEAKNNININANLTTNGYAIDLIADSDSSGNGKFTLAESKTVSSNNGADITLLASEIDLKANSSINSGLGNIYIRNSKSGRDIALGGAFSNTTFVIDDAEIPALNTQGTLIIGSAIATDDIRLNSADFGDRKVSLFCSNKIQRTGSGINITTTSLILYAAKGINLETQVSNLQATNITSGNININNTGHLTATSIANSAPGGQVNIVVNSNLTVGSISADTVNLSAEGSIYGDGLRTETKPYNIIAQTLYLDAGQDVGKDNSEDHTLYTQVQNLYAFAGGDIGLILGPEEIGGPYFDPGILNTGDLDLLEVEANRVAIEVASDINVGSVTAVEAVGLEAEGSILALLDEEEDNISSIQAPVLYLNAGGDIGKDELLRNELGNIVLDESGQPITVTNRTLYTQVDELYAFAGGDIGYLVTNLSDLNIYIPYEGEASAGIGVNPAVCTLYGDPDPGHSWYGTLGVTTNANYGIVRIEQNLYPRLIWISLDPNGLVTEKAIYMPTLRMFPIFGKDAYLHPDIVEPYISYDSGHAYRVGQLSVSTGGVGMVRVKVIANLSAYVFETPLEPVSPPLPDSFQDLGGYFEPGILNNKNLSVKEVEAEGQVAIETQSDITVDLIDANRVGLVASGSINGDGSTDEGGVPLTNITAETLYLKVGEDIGSINPLYTDIDKLYAYAGQNIGIMEESTPENPEGTFIPGIFNYGDLVLNEVLANGVATIQAASDVTVGLVLGEAVGLVSSGSINGDGTGSLITPNILADVLYLDAAVDIGTTNALYTNIDELYAFAGGDIGVILGPEEIEGPYFDPGILNNGDLDLIEVKANRVALRAESNLYVGEVIAEEVVGLEADGSILALLDEGNNLSDIEASVLYLEAGEDIGKDFYDIGGGNYMVEDRTLHTEIDELDALAGGEIGSAKFPDEEIYQNLVYFFLDPGILNEGNLRLTNLTANRATIQTNGNLTVGSIDVDDKLGLIATGSIDGNGAGGVNIIANTLSLEAGLDIGKISTLYTDINELYAYAGGDIGDSVSGNPGILDEGDFTLKELVAGFNNGIPQFIKADYIELGKVSRISKFRSGEGHDYSDIFEDFRSMKHYFDASDYYNEETGSTQINIFSPVDGTIVLMRSESSPEENDIQIQIKPDNYPGFIVVLFHVSPLPGLERGDRVSAGQLLGEICVYRHGSDEPRPRNDVAITLGHEGGTKCFKLFSYFDALDDNVFENYADRGISSRSEFIISKGERDSDPLICTAEGGDFIDRGAIPNWVELEDTPGDEPEENQAIRLGTAIIESEGNLTVGSVLAETVDLTSNSGSILDGNGELTNIIANNAYLYALDSIGEDNTPISTDLDSLEAIADTGSIYINEITDGITLERVISQGPGSIEITTNGNIEVGYIYDPSSVTLIANNGGSIIGLNQGVDDEYPNPNIETRTLTLDADRSIYGEYLSGFLPGFLVINADTLYAYAGRADYPGGIYLVNLQSISSPAITLEEVKVNNASDSDAVLIASLVDINVREVSCPTTVMLYAGDWISGESSASIIGLPPLGPNVIQTSDLYLYASNSIYGSYYADKNFPENTSNGFLTTNASYIEAFASGYYYDEDIGDYVQSSGIINIYDTSSVELFDVQANGGESIYIIADGDMYVDYVSDPNDVTLEATNGSIIGQNDDGSLDIDTDGLYLYASDSIYGSYDLSDDVYFYENYDNNFLVTNASYIEAVADGYDGEGNIDIYDTSSVELGYIKASFVPPPLPPQPPDGPTCVYIVADGSIYVDYVSDPSRVTLEALYGSIIGQDEWDVDIDTEELYLFATGSIYGNYDPGWTYYREDFGANFLTTNTTYLEAIAYGWDGMGDLYIYDTNSVELADVEAFCGKTVYIVSEGSLYVDYVYDDNNVVLEALAGSIIGLEGNLITAGDIYLYANNGIGDVATDSAINTISLWYDSVIAHNYLTGSIYIVDHGDEVYFVVTNEAPSQLIKLVSEPSGAYLNLGNVSSNNGDIDVLSSGDIYVWGLVYSGAGNITLKAYDPPDHYTEDHYIEVYGTILSTSGNIDLIADADDEGKIGIYSGGSIYSDSGNISLKAQAQGSSAHIDVYGLIYTTTATEGEGNITLQAVNTINNEVTGNYYDESERYAQINVSDTEISSNAGDITLEAANYISNSVWNCGYYYDYSYNYAKIDIDYSSIHSVAGNINLSATNIIDIYINEDIAPIDLTGIYLYYDDFVNYAEVNIYNEDVLTIATEGNIDISASNTIIRDISADYIEDYEDDSDTEAYVYIYDTLDTTNEEGTSMDEINISALNDISTTVYVNDYIGDYEDESYNYAYIEVGNWWSWYYYGYGYDIFSDIGDITLTASNTVTRDITADSIGIYEEDEEDYIYFEFDGGYEDDSDNEAYIYVYTSLTSISGNIDISATNDTETTVVVTDSIADYEDDSDNYAEIEIGDWWSWYYGNGSDISTDGDISITAENTIIRDIIADGIASYSGYYDPESDEYYYEEYWGGYEDDSYNYAYVDIEYSSIYAGTGDIGISAANKLTTYINEGIEPTEVSGGIYEYDDDSYNYAEVYIYNYEDSTISTIGNINISASNTIIRDISADYIEDYEDDSDTEAYVYIYDTLDTTNEEGTSMDEINISALNDISTTVYVNDYIGDYEDESYNYAYIYVSEYDTISTNSGDINLSASNTITKDITADSIGTYDEWYEDSILYFEYDGGYEDDSDNEAYVYIYTPVSSDSGNIDISATNDIETILTVTDSIADYEDKSYNYAYLYVYSPETILTDTGDISLTTSNTLTRDIFADSMASYWGYYSDSVPVYDEYWGGYEDDSDNEAYLDIEYTSIYSDTGNIELSATNTLITRINEGIDPDTLGGIYDYEEDSYNYAEVYIYNEEDGTISTQGHTEGDDPGGISLTAANTVEREVNTNYIECYEDDSYNEAYIYLYDTLTTTPDGIASNGEINLVATNTVLSVINSEVNEYYDNGYGYAEVNLGSSDTIITDNGDINISATSTGSGWHEAYVYIYTPLTSNSGNITVTAQADDYAEIGIYDTVSTTTGDITMTADDYEIGGETIISDSGDITLRNASAGRAIALGLGYQTGADNLEVDAEEITRIITDGWITIGSATAGPITVGSADFGDSRVALISGDNINGLEGSVENPNLVASVLYLVAGGNIGDINNDSFLITDVDYLYAYAGGSIGIYDIDSLELVDVRGGLTEEEIDSIIMETMSLNFEEIKADVYIFAINDINVGHIYDPLYVYLQSFAGSINNAETEFDAFDANVETRTLKMCASGDINQLTTDIDNLYAYAGGWIKVYDIGSSLTLVDVQGGLGEVVNTYGVDWDYRTYTWTATRVREEDVYIYANNDIYVGHVYDSLYVYLESYDGSINSIDTEFDANIKTKVLKMYAATGIGASDNPLNTQVDTLSAYTTASDADIYIAEFDGIGIAELITDGDTVITANGSSTLGSISTGGDFSFTTSTGAITVLTGTVTSTAGGVTLITLGGSIIAIGPGPHLVAADDSLLETSGVINFSLDAPFDVLLTSGELEVIIGDAIGGISGVLAGSTPSGTIIVNTVPTPPGIVYFNGTQIYPPLPTGLSDYILGQYANSLVFTFLLPVLEQLAGYQINTFTGAVYLYHPLTPTDMSAFEAFILEEGAYEFIEGVINIIGHEGLLPILEEIKKK